MAAAGYDTFLVVADGKGNETIDEVQILDAGAPRGRFDRMWNATRRIYAMAKRLGADIYHLHDPELMVTGLALRLSGKKVVFDAHEDLPKQLLTKPYLPAWSRRSLACVAGVVESVVLRSMSGLVAATPAIERKLKRYNRAVIVNNYPLPSQLCSPYHDCPKNNEVSYIGGVTRIRGSQELVRAMVLVKSGARLNLAGPIESESFRSELEMEAGWSAVNLLGVIGREEVSETLARSIAGLVTFLPLPNHVEAQPNKMFEYMAAGLPVVASHFPLWREIIEEVGCGVCVDPSRPEDIASAIDWLIEHPEEARAMGARGRAAIYDRFNWSTEAESLIRYYEQL